VLALNFAAKALLAARPRAVELLFLQGAELLLLIQNLLFALLDFLPVPVEGLLDSHFDEFPDLVEQVGMVAAFAPVEKPVSFGGIRVEHVVRRCMHDIFSLLN